ncbi:MULTISPECIES: hypothetical protein [unclassified Bradyrhizobium]
MGIAAGSTTPLNHFEWLSVVDLQAQIVNSDGQMPTIYLPQSFGLEFTEKFEPPAMLAIPLAIGVNRLISAACLTKAAVPALVRRRFKDRQVRGHS